jgi:tRNA(Ile)-lysidine synthase
LLQIVLNTIRKHDLIPSDSKVLVGVSGGADSLALLHVLHTLREQLDCQLHVATLDHGLRGEASAEDVRFVMDICQQWGIRASVAKRKVSPQGMGVENSAREVRYAFFAETALQYGARVVAVAHHADDQAETILMHILRGAGARGMQGMAYKAPMPKLSKDAVLVRPLLDVTRQQVETYCRENGLQPRHDATNDDVNYTRNYIRHEIMPRLQKVNPRATFALSRLAEVISTEQLYLDEQLQTALDGKIEMISSRLSIRLSRQYFDLMPLTLQRRFIPWALEKMGRAKDLSYERITAAVELAQTGQVGAIAELPHNTQLRIGYKTLIIEDRSLPSIVLTHMRLDKDSEYPLVIPDKFKPPLYDWGLISSFEPSETLAARLDIPEGAQIILRTRRQGERFAPLGLNGHTQKLGEWMVDHKVPRAIRDNIPLIVVNGEVAAILYGEQWTISHHFAVREESKRVVYFAKY